MDVAQKRKIIANLARPLGVTTLGPLSWLKNRVRVREKAEKLDPLTISKFNLKWCQYFIKISWKIVSISGNTFPYVYKIIQEKRNSKGLFLRCSKSSFHERLESSSPGPASKPLSSILERRLHESSAGKRPARRLMTCLLNHHYSKNCCRHCSGRAKREHLCRIVLLFYVLLV